MKRNGSAGLVLLARVNAVSVGAGGFPAVCFVASPRAAFNGYEIAYHKRGIETHAELADDINIRIFGLFIGPFSAFFISVFEFERTAARDRAEVILQLVLCHTDAVVPDLERPGFFVRRDPDLVIRTQKRDAAVGERAEVELIYSVAGVRDKFAQEDFLMGIDGIDHHIQKFLRFSLKLFLCHINPSFLYMHRLKGG